jgi:hypothetical protein
LRIADELGSQQDFARTWKVNPSNAQRRFARLEKNGILARIPHTKPVAYELLAPGKCMLSELRRVFGDRNLEELRGSVEVTPWRLHHVELRLPIVNLPKDFAVRLRERGGVAVQHGINRGTEFSFEGATVLFMPSSILVFIHQWRSRNAAHLVQSAVELGFRVRNWAEARFGIVCDLSEDICRQHIASEGSANRWLADGSYYESNRVLIDCSPGWPEVEFINKKYGLIDAEHYGRLVDAAVRKPENIAAFADGHKFQMSTAQAIILLGERMSKLEEGKGNG